MRQHLPVLQSDDIFNRIGVGSPCTADWNAMRGGERVRHCGQCRQNVYNLSEMSRPEALALIQAREGRMCVRLFRRPDGTMVTQDCWERLRAARRRGRIAFMVALVVIGFSQLALKVAGVMAIWRWIEVGRAVERPVMGEMVVAPEPVMPVMEPATPAEPVVEPAEPVVDPAPEAAPTPPKRPHTKKPPRLPHDKKYPLMGKLAMPPEPLMGDMIVDDVK